jgi:hypothetical protein
MLALAAVMPEVSPLEHIDMAVTALSNRGGEARVSYVSFIARAHGTLNFGRLCGATRRSKIVQHVQLSSGSPSSIGKKRPSLISFVIPACASHGKVSVKITNVSHIEVHAHTDGAGMSEVNASIQRILAHAGSKRIETWSVTLIQLYWFWGKRLELDSVHRELLAPGACGAEIRVLRDARRVRITAPHVSASVAACGTLSVVCRCAPSLRRVARELGEVLARSEESKKIACTERA